MQVLLLLFLMLPCLPEKWSPAAWRPSTSSSSLLTWAGIGLAVLLAAAIAHRLSRQLRRLPEHRESLLRRYARFRVIHTLVLIGIYLTALYGFGWGWTVQSLLGRSDGLLPGAELIVLSPFFAGLMGSWACFYDAERAIHQSARCATQDDRSAEAPAMVKTCPSCSFSPIAPFTDSCPMCAEPLRNLGGSRPVVRHEHDWSRSRYVLFHLRQNIALAFLPVLLFIAVKSLRSVLGVNDDLLGMLIGLGGMLTFVTLFPWLFRRVLGLKPLPDGPMRDRLMAAAARLRVRCSNILLWKTRNSMANAMVMGIFPWLRYIIFTDHLLSDMTPEEVEAVFGHEVGHVKHRHIIFYFCFLMLSLAAVWAVWVLGTALLDDLLSRLPVQTSFVDATLGQQWAVLPPIFMVAAYIFVVFGYISRRCERQADIYGCRAVSCTDPHCQGHAEEFMPAERAKGLCPTGINIFISALEKVASLNGISRDRPGWLQSWQHGTIAQRVDFLATMRDDMAIEPRFQRRVALVKVGLVVVLAAFLMLAGAVAGWEILLAVS